MTRIAYIINSVEGGGAALPVPSIVELLRRQGFTVEVLALTRRDGRALPAFAAAGIPVHVRDGGEKDHLAALRWISRKLDELRPNLLWTSLTRATLLGQWVGARHSLPVVSWQHNAFLKPANLRLLRWRQGQSALWIADSEKVAALTRQRLGIEADRVMVWPIFRADPDAPQSTAWRDGEPVRLGTLGRLHPAKGYDVLIEAMAMLGGGLPPFSVTIAGEGRQRADLERRIAELALPVTLPGFVGDARALLAGLHLYLQPSRVEGLCVAAHEAMAAGLPVIGGRTGEMPTTILEGETGLIVAPGDAMALADALSKLLRSPGTLHAMGAAARRRVLDRFGPDRFDAAGSAVAERIREILTARRKA